MLSIISTVYNEGDEVRRTVASIISHTHNPFEIVVVDDGSTDRCCEALESEQIRIVRNERRMGVACSRDRAVQIAKGNAVAFLDGHQRVSAGSLNRCAEVANRDSAIVCPDIRGFNARSRTAHGATFRLCSKHGYFSATWRLRTPRVQLTRVTSLHSPVYVMSRDTYSRVHWIEGLKNWGGSEAAISLKAFFLDIPILHLCGPLTHHNFKQKLEYDATWDDVWRNHALIARVCFDERTWYDHWLPYVFEPYLTDEAQRVLESKTVLEQHEKFLALKVRPDSEFWTDLLRRDIPPALK